MGAKCATAKWHGLARWGSKFAGKLYCVCMVEIIMLMADSPKSLSSTGTDSDGPGPPWSKKKKFSSLIFNKK